MDEDQVKELRELVEFLKANEVAEFDMERPDLKVRLKFASGVETTDLGQISRLLAALPQAAAVAPMPLAPGVQVQLGTAATEGAGAESATAAPAAAEEKLHEVKSPLVGTFYESASPGAAPFVRVGDQVEVGQVLCIVEAMKLMNEIESDVAGEVVRRIASSGQPVEYGQSLFVVRPQ